MKVADLVCHRSLHGKCRVRVEYASAWIYIGAKIYTTDLLSIFCFDYETCISSFIMLKGYLTIQPQKGVSYTAYLCFSKLGRRPSSEQ